MNMASLQPHLPGQFIFTVIWPVGKHLDENVLSESKMIVFRPALTH
jgi:hypothetical protein